MRRPVLALTGFSRSGKDTLANELASRGWLHLKTSSAIKETLWALNPTVLTEGHHISLQHLVADPSDDEQWTIAKRLSWQVVPLLQRLGNECQSTIYVGVWADVLRSKVAQARAVDPLVRIVVSDCRHPIEVAVVDRIARITRPGTGPINNNKIESMFLEFDRDIDLLNNSDDPTEFATKAANYLEMIL